MEKKYTLIFQYTIFNNNSDVPLVGTLEYTR